MKLFSMLLISAALVAASTAQAAPVYKQPFEEVIHISAASDATESAAYSGKDYTSPKGFFDGDLWTIPAGAVIEDMYVIVDEVVSGVTLFELGDDDDANDFIASATSPLASLGEHYDLPTSKGAYLKLTNGSENWLRKKFYSAAGKELKLNVTGTATAGKIRVVVKGYSLNP